MWHHNFVENFFFWKSTYGHVIKFWLSLVDGCYLLFPKNRTHKVSGVLFHFFASLFATCIPPASYLKFNREIYIILHRGVTKVGHVPRAPNFRGRQIGEKRNIFTKKQAPNQLFLRYIIYFNIISVSKYLGGAKFRLAPGAIYPSYATDPTIQELSSIIL